MSKIKSFVDAGAITSFHADSTGSPLEQIFIAATRRTVKDAQIALDYSKYSKELLEKHSDETRGNKEQINGLTSLKCLTRNRTHFRKKKSILVA